MKLRLLFYSLFAASFSFSEAQSNPAPPSAPDAILALWPQRKMPGHGAAQPEKEEKPRKDGVQRITNVSQPTLAVFKAPGQTGPTPAMIICPGGGYGILAYDKEGTEIAAWLNSLGITGIVLKYRVPGNREGAFQDIQRAFRLARQHAGEWKINPDHLGVIGFSAGGHLAARLSTNFDQVAYPPVDSADLLGCQPNFVVLVYPAYLQVNGKVAPELPITGKIPPTLIVHTEDDLTFVPGSKIYHAALDAAKVPNKFLLYPTGGHGYGLRSKKAVHVWPEQAADWLRQLGILSSVGK